MIDGEGWGSSLGLAALFPSVSDTLMGTIKAIVDLTTQLASSVTDRKIAGELNAIQTLLLQLQSEQVDLHDANMKLKEERLILKQRIQELEAEVGELVAGPVQGPAGVPACPNCKYC